MIKKNRGLKGIIVCGLFSFLSNFPSWAESMKPFSLPSVTSSGTIDSKDYKGKVLIVDFWASWCGPCKASFAAYNELLKKYGDKGLAIIGINIDNDKEKALEFLADNPASFPIAIDSDKKVASMYNLPTMPSAYIIARSGDILHTHAGYHEGDIATMEKEIEAALGEKEKDPSQAQNEDASE